MGKSLIIPGADFSQNGMRVNNVVNILMDSESTNPFKFYFLPTAMTYIDNPNLPSLPVDAVENSVTADADVPINGNYAAIFIGRDSSMPDTAKFIGSISVNYKNVISDANQLANYLIADEIDLIGMNFGDGCVADKMFCGAAARTLKMPDIRIDSGKYMFYNFNGEYEAERLHTSFTFIKKITTSLVSMFQWLKSASADFSGIDVSTAYLFSSAFENCKLSEIDLSTWNIGNVQWAVNMFANCPNLATLHIDNWNSIVESGHTPDMFTNTPNLATVFVTNCTSEAKTWLLARLNECNAGGSSNWSETTVQGKAALTHS